MSWLWVAAWLAAGAWLFLLRVFVEPSLATGLVLVGVGLLCAGFGTRSSPSPRLSVRAAVVLALLLIVIIVLCPPEMHVPGRFELDQASSPQTAQQPGPLPVNIALRIPAILALLGVALWVCPQGAGGLRGIGRAGLILAAMLTAAYAGLLAYVWIAARGHITPDTGPIVQGLTELLGMPVAYHDGWLTLETMRAPHTFPVSWELLGLPIALPMLVIGLPLAGLWGRRRAGWDMLIFVLVLAAWACIRAALIVAFYENEAMLTGYYEKFALMDILWHPVAFLVSFVPLTLLLIRMVPLRPRAPQPAPSTNPPVPDSPVRTGTVGPVLGALAASLLVVAYGWYDPGERKAGRVVMDESHSQWERSDRPYDTEWYGHESGYNYAAIYDFLDHYYHMQRNTEPWTPERLANVDVLILKNPTEAYAKEEIDAIEQFVRNGGGVWLVGEHTNVFGTSSYLNPICRRFGLVFDDDVCFDIVTKFIQTYFPRKLLKHPTILDMPWFRFETSCSIAVQGLTGVPAITGWALKSLHADYHIQNFYPAPDDQASMQFGPFIQLYARRFGQGRVVAFSDSTCFSNFSAFETGKPEMLLGTIEWLNRRNRLDPNVWYGMAAAGLVLALVALLATWHQRSPASMLALAVTMAAAGSAAAKVVDLVNRRNYSPPEPRRSITRIGFDREHGPYRLSDGGFVRSVVKDETGKQDTNSFALFNQWALRVGQFPLRYARFEDALENCEVAVVINPTEPFSATEVERARCFVQHGGRLLVLDDPSNTNSQANGLLGAFGLKIAESQPKTGTLITPAGQSWNISATGRPVEGGTPLLLVGETTVAALKQLGQGRCVVISCASVFCDEKMGRSDRTIPSPRLRRRFDLVYTLWRSLSGAAPMSLAPPKRALIPRTRVTQPAASAPRHAHVHASEPAASRPSPSR